MAMRVCDELQNVLGVTSFLEELFDPVSDIVFFIKDREGRYVCVNWTLVKRCGLVDKSGLVGRTAGDVFPRPLGDRYFRQDQRVLSTRVPIIDRLELHLFPNRLEGWCLTNKVPIVDHDGAIVGLAGLSRDLSAPKEGDDRIQPELARVVNHVQSHYADELRVDELARMAGISPYQLNRRIRAIFGITPTQLIAKTRIDSASLLLRAGQTPIAEIAQMVGYCDQSAFSRQFKARVGLTPRQYRALRG
jgi:AraC-like DNA-binding protein